MKVTFHQPILLILNFNHNASSLRADVLSFITCVKENDKMDDLSNVQEFRVSQNNEVLNSAVEAVPNEVTEHDEVAEVIEAVEVAETVFDGGLPSNVIALENGVNGQSLAARFNGLMNSSTLHSVELGKIIVHAKLLKKIERDYFFKTINYEAGSKSIIKLQAIGNKTIFTKIIDQLPPGWTTLYTLTNIPDDALVNLTEQGRLSVKTTGAEAIEIAKLYGYKTRTKAKGSTQNLPRISPTVPIDPVVITQPLLPTNSYSIAIQFDATPSNIEIAELHAFATEYAIRNKCSLAFSTLVANLLADIKAAECEGA